MSKPKYISVTLVVEIQAQGFTGHKTYTLRSLIKGEALIKGWLEFLSKFDNQVGSNNSREDGKKFICVGEKRKRLEILMNINKLGGSNNNG